MPNPSPRQTEEFKKHRYQPKGAVYSDYPLADKPTQVRLAEDITAAVDALGNDKTPWLRRVITEAAKRELLGQATVSEKATPSPQANCLLTRQEAERLGEDLIKQRKSLKKALPILLDAIFGESPPTPADLQSAPEPSNPPGKP